MRRSRKKGDARLQEVPTPEPGPGQVLIAVEAAGVCGSDIEVHHAELSPDSRVIPPVILGHEGAGRVAGLGEGVDDLELGQAVLAETTYRVCGVCQYCQRGELNLCPERKGMGSTANGFFASYAVARRESVHVLPERVSTMVGAITEPLACATHAVMERAQLTSGETAVVFGPGGMGLMAALAVSAVGGRSLLVGTTHSRHRLQFAERHGFARTYDVQSPGFLDSLRDHLGVGADVVFECTGRLSALETGMKLLRPGGRLIVLGEVDQPLILNTRETLLRRELTLAGSRSSIPSSWSKALELLPRVAPTLEAMISYSLPLSRWQEAYDLVSKKEALKVVLIPDEADKEESMIKPELVRMGLDVPDREGAIRALAGLLEQGGYVKDSFVGAVLERERTFPTGLPTGDVSVAIPHADSEHVLRSAIAVGVLAHPIGFQQMGDPETCLDVDLVMVLAIRNPKAVVPFLQKACMAFQDQELLGRIKSAADPEEVSDLLRARLEDTREA